MVARLGSVLGAASDEDAAIVCLNRAKSDGNHKVYVQHLSLFPLVIYVVECYNFLIKLEEMDFVCLHLFFNNALALLGRLASHSYTSQVEVVCHRQLRVPVEADVLTLLAVVARLFIYLQSSQTLTSVDLASSGNIVASVHLASLPDNHLLEQNLVDLDVAVVHDQILGHKVLED